MKFYNLSKCKLYKSLQSSKNLQLIEVNEIDENIFEIVINKDFLKKFETYIFENINALDYTKNPTKKDAFKILLREFKQSSLCNNNILKVGRRNAFKNYLQGLPSILNIEHSYIAIENLLFDFLKYSNNQKEKNNKLKTILKTADSVTMVNFYYYFMELATNNILRGLKLKTLDELETI